jgi:hypothetical protein
MMIAPEGARSNREELALFHLFEVKADIDAAPVKRRQAASLLFELVSPKRLDPLDLVKGAAGGGLTKRGPI